MVQNQNKSNYDLTYMASFWKENQLVQTKKISSKESSWFGEFENTKLITTKLFWRTKV
jgi:hypothetical protein